MSQQPDSSPRITRRLETPPVDPATTPGDGSTGPQDTAALPAMFAGARYRNPAGHEILLHTQEFEGVQDHGELWWGNRIRDGRCEPLLVTPRGLVYHLYTPTEETTR